MSSTKCAKGGLYRTYLAVSLKQGLVEENVFLVWLNVPAADAVEHQKDFCRM